MYGQEDVPKDVLEYVVFERQLSNPYGSWRMHAKIVPPWAPPKQPILKVRRAHGAMLLGLHLVEGGGSLTPRTLGWVGANSTSSCFQTLMIPSPQLQLWENCEGAPAEAPGPKPT